MIQTIIEALDLAAAQTLPVVTRHGLSERRDNAVYAYAGDGQWLPVNNDNGGTYSYWRLTGTVDEVSVDGTSCNNDFQATYRLRLVCLLDREICPNVIDAARATMSQLRGSDDDIRQTLKLRRVNIDTARLNVDSPSVFQQEFGVAGDILPSQMLLAIDVTVVAIGKAECFMPCGASTSLLCQTIAAATWAKIKACMSEGQIDAAIADLCESGPCPPTTVNGTESDTPTIVVRQGGVEVGTLNPATGVHTVPECEEPTCDPMTVSLGGVQIVNQADPCGAEVELTCETTVDAYVVEGATETQKNGLYIDNGIVNGRTSYALAPNHTIEWNGTEYDLIDIFTGIDWQTTNSPGRPSSGVWVELPGGDPIVGTVRGAVISDICDTPCDPATISVNDTLVDTAEDPCGHTFSLVVKNEDDTQVGSLVGGEWIVPTAKSLCALVTESTAEEVSTCIISSGKRADVLAELIPTVDAADAVTQVFTPLSDDGELAVGDYLYSDYLCSDADAARYIAILQAKDGQMLEPGVRAAICALFAGLKADGIYTALQASALLVGARTLNGTMTNLNGIGGPSNNNFVDADYNRKTGLLGNGSSKWLMTNRNNSADPQNDNSMGVWINSVTTASGVYMGAGSSDTGANFMSRRASPNDGDIVTRSRTSTATIGTGTGASTGLLGMSRAASGSYTVRSNATNTTVTQASQTPLDRIVAVYASQGVSTPFNYADARLQFYWQGTSVDMALLEARISTYLTAIAAAIP